MIEAFKGLNDHEKEIVSSMALLPGEFFSIPQLSLFFYIEENEYAAFFDTIHDLSKNGFFESEKGSYAIKSEIAKEILEKIKPGIEECPRIVNYFIDKMEVPTKDYEGIFLPVYNQLASVLERIDKKSLHLAQLSYLLSSNLIRHKKFQEALEYNQLAVKISEDIDDHHPLVALFYRDKAYIYKKMGNHDKAIYYSLKDIEILERHQGKYNDLLPDSYFALSKTYEVVHNYNKAVEYNLKAIQYVQDVQRKSNKLSYLYQNLAFYYAKLNNLHHASIFINKAVEFYTSENKKDKFEYLQLMRDQKKYNSLHEIELIIRKFKYPIIVFVGFSFGILLWIIYKLLF